MVCLPHLAISSSDNVDKMGVCVLRDSAGRHESANANEIDERLRNRRGPWHSELRPDRGPVVAPIVRTLARPRAALRIGLHAAQARAARISAGRAAGRPPLSQDRALTGTIAAAGMPHCIIDSLNVHAAKGAENACPKRSPLWVANSWAQPPFGKFSVVSSGFSASGNARSRKVLVVAA